MLKKESISDFLPEIIGAINYAIITTDLTMNITFVNEAGAKLLKSSVEKMIGEPLQKFAKPLVSDNELNEIIETLSKGETWSGDVLIECHDGSQIHTQSYDSPIINEAGEIIGFVGTKMDVSDRKSREAELVELKIAAQKSAQSIRKLLEATPDAILAVNEDGFIVFSNNQVEQIFGYTSAEIRLTNITEYIIDDRAAILLDFIASKNKSAVWIEHSFKIELFATDRLNNKFPAEITATYFQIDAEWLTILAFRDNSHIRKNEENLKRREAILSAVVMCSEYLLSETNWQEKIDEIITLLGQAADASRAYLFENNYVNNNVFSSQKYEWCKNGVQSELNNPMLQNLDIENSQLAFLKYNMLNNQVVRGNTENFPLPERALLESQGINSVLVIPIYVYSRWWGFIGFDQCESNRDWSDIEVDALKVSAKILGAAVEKYDQLKLLKENEEKLIQYNKELEVSNQELEQFAYVASHDLQEPLRMISSFLTLLEKKYGNSLDEKALSYVNFAVDGASRMRQIILDLLEFSRLGKSIHKDEITDANQILTDSIRLLDSQILENHAEIIIATELPKLCIPRTHLLQIFQNLLGNAIKYKRKDVNPLIEIKYEENETYHQITFKDNGIGIPENYHDRIFQIFQRLHNSNDYKGTGVGLAIVKKVMDTIGGEVGLKSIEGRGSEFILSFPKLDQD